MKTCLKASIFLSALMAIPSLAAEAVVWQDGKIGDDAPPEMWYDYTYGSGVSVSFKEPSATGKTYSVSATFKATASATDQSGAGFGFYWSMTTPKEGVDQQPVTHSVADYGGVCLSYSATQKLRMDFKQNDIDEEAGCSSFGVDLSSTDGDLKTVFVSFEDFKLAWKGSNCPTTWRPKFVLGPKFSNKGEKKAFTNSVEITKFVLADECPSFAPTVKSTFKNTSNKLNEGESLKFKMSDIFEDKDGDDLSIEAKISGSEDVVLTSEEKTTYSLTDSLVFEVKPNPSGTLTIELTATDPTNKTAKTTITIDAVDIPHNPVVKDTVLTMRQGETLHFEGMYTILAYDLDGDDFTLKLVEGLTDENGEEVEGLTFDDLRGFFDFEPDPDFIGNVSFKIMAFEDTAVTHESEIATITIKVKDMPTFTRPEGDDDVWMLEYSFDGTKGEINVDTENADELVPLILDEDFGSVVVSLDDKHLKWYSGKGEKPELVAVGNDFVDAELVMTGKVQDLQISSKDNAFGKGLVYLIVTDGEFSDTLFMLLNVKSVVDTPVAVKDAYEVTRGDSLKVKAEDGVLANDSDGDGDEFFAKLTKDPEHGILEIKKDGSFTYVSEDGYEGSDSFTYFAFKVIDEDTLKSAEVSVAIEILHKNQPPVIAEGVADTAGQRLTDRLTEDKPMGIASYTKDEVKTWFTDPEGEEITIKFENKDGKLKIVDGPTNYIVSPVPDSCGRTEIIVTATDASGDSVELVISGIIKPVNDKPVVRDTSYKVAVSGWEMTIDLDSLAYDIDGDTLSFAIQRSYGSITQSFDITFDSVDVSLMTIKVKDYVKLTAGDVHSMAVNVYDGHDSARVTIQFKVDGSIPPPVVGAIHKTIAKAKYTWKNAIARTRGTVAIMDLQGRVMWNAKLPVSESDVRAASAKVQGRKVLRVNSQTWTIK